MNQLLNFKTKALNELQLAGFNCNHSFLFEYGGNRPIFKKCGPKAAISSIIAGLLTLIITKEAKINNLALEVALPTIVSAIVFIAVGFATKTVPGKVNKLVAALKKPK